MRTAILVLVAALVPTVAHAEFAAQRRDDLRPSSLTTIKRARFERVPARIAVVTPPRLTVDEVLSKINTIYMTGLQRCYRQSLKVDPTISGKVVLTFQVDGEGRVQSKLDGLDSKIDGCLSRVISSWRFSIPATAQDGSFRISLLLQSN